MAVSISSLVTWRNVSWAIDVAMRCSAACSFFSSVVADLALRLGPDGERSSKNL